MVPVLEAKKEVPVEVSVMRNYLYVSDAKVDMYLPQITPVEKQKVAARLGFNVGLLTGSIETVRMSLDNRIYRLAAVEEEIRRKHAIGSVEKLSSWIEGVLKVAAASFPGHPDLMFFFWNETDHFFGLTGSAHHIVGNIRPLTASCSLSYVHSLLSTLEAVVDKYSFVIEKEDAELSRFLHTGKRESDVHEWTRIMDLISHEFDDVPTQKVSFLARQLTSQLWRANDKRYTLATPLYIALEDD
jgi:Family of unknown function (DUF7019)